MEERIKQSLRPAQAAKKLGCSLPTFWRLARNDPDFPRLCKVSERITTVDNDELDAFVAARKTKRVAA